MSSHYRIMPIDRATIKTQLSIHPDLFDDPAAFTRKHDLPIRTTKPTRGKCKYGPTRNLTLDVLAYKGIKVKLTITDDDPLAVATIHFNPGVCLYGHNGRLLSLTEFLDALGLLVTNLKPLLEDPNDWVDLIPGLRSNGWAHWSYLEVLFQCRDSDGTLFSGFRHLHHPKLKTIRHWPTSIKVGGYRGKLQLGIYWKAIEMVEHGKLSESELPTYHEILRLEARMKDKKLVEYFGNERNVEVIDGTKQLVCFYPHDLILGLLKCFSELQGVYSSDEAPEELNPKDQLAPLGRLLAQVALDPRTSHTFPELLAHLKFYTGAGPDSDTIDDIRAAGLAELSRRSSISSDDLFSDAGYRLACAIVSEKPEEKICHESDDTFVHRLIYAAYRPPDQPFQPVLELPGYHRF